MLIRFSDSPKVYDINKGTFEWIPSVEEFNKRGYKWSDVKIIDKNNIPLTRQEGDVKVYAKIDGQNIHIPDEKTFSDIGFDWNKIQIGQPQSQKKPPTTKQEIDYTDQVNRIYSENFGRNATQTEINDWNTQIKGGQQTTDSLKQWAETNPQNIKKIGQVSQPQAFQGQPFQYEELGDIQLRDFNWELNPAFETYGEKLYQFWKTNSDIQSVYGSDLKGLPGTRAEGTTLQQWALIGGWREDPQLLAAYKPSNFVRTAYRFELRGEDPLGSRSYDPGALDWVNAVKSGEIGSYTGLTGKMRLDTGGEWKNLGEGEKTAIITEGLIPPEEIRNIPKFSEIFKKEQVRTKIEEDVNKWYDKQIKDYLEGREIKEKRTIEDWETLTKQLTEDEERELTDVEKQYRQALSQATEAYGMAGLAFSSLRISGELELEEAKKRGEEKIKTQVQRAKEKTELAKIRELEDVSREARLEQEKFERERAKEKETEFTQRRREALAEYSAVTERILTPEELGTTL